MRFLTLLACLLVAAGCSVDDTAGDPQAAAPALRNATFAAASVSYRVQDGAGNTTNYTGPPGFAAGTSATVSADGTDLSLATSTTVDNGQQVLFNDQLQLPPSLSEFSGPLHWPQQNRSLAQSAFGGWDLPASASVPATGTFFAFGVVTDPPAIPVTSTVTYTGRWTGIQWSVSGGTTFTGIDVSGTFTAIVDYFNRSVQVTALNAGGSANTMTGTLSYATGTNALSGASMSGPTGFTGSAIARFFGPVGQELGGTFRLNQAATPSGTNVIIGSFAAKRP